MACAWHQKYCKEAKPQSSPDGSIGVSLRGPKSDFGEGLLTPRLFQSLFSHAPGMAWGLAAREASGLSQIAQ